MTHVCSHCLVPLQILDPPSTFMNSSTVHPCLSTVDRSGWRPITVMIWCSCSEVLSWEMALSINHVCMAVGLYARILQKTELPVICSVFNFQTITQKRRRNSAKLSWDTGPTLLEPGRAQWLPPKCDWLSFANTDNSFLTKTGSLLYGKTAIKSQWRSNPSLFHQKNKSVAHGCGLVGTQSLSVKWVALAGGTAHWTQQGDHFCHSVMQSVHPHPLPLHGLTVCFYHPLNCKCIYSLLTLPVASSTLKHLISSQYSFSNIGMPRYLVFRWLHCLVGFYEKNTLGLGHTW